MKSLLTIALALSSVPAFAGSVNMTCSQAQNYYRTHGRIYVRTGGGDIVPIYGLVNSCGPGYSRSPYWVQATDSRTCVLGYRCNRHEH